MADLPSSRIIQLSRQEQRWRSRAQAQSAAAPDSHFQPKSAGGGAAFPTIKPIGCRCSRGSGSIPASLWQEEPR